jgi:predicted amidohydrolase
MRVGYLQYAPRLGQIDWNLKKVVELLSGVTADLMVLPELAFTGYAFRDRDEARRYAHNPEESVIVDKLISLCESKDMHIVTGFAELDGEQIFNSSLLIGPRGIESVYRKLHLFNTEKNCFDPGDKPLDVIRVKNAKVGMMVCFDWIFPEVARELSVRGADMICHPSNLIIPDKCQYSMVTRCIENRVFAVTANRYGNERGVDFTGASQIVGPGGETLHSGPKAQDEIFVTELDPELARDKKINSKNDLMLDRRAGFDYQI